MLEWNRLSKNQLADYVDLNLTLDQQAERVIEIVTDIMFTDDVIENERKSTGFSYHWRKMDDDSLIHFISINMTLLDQAKDVYNNNLGSKVLTEDVKDLIDEIIDEFSLTNMIDDVVFMIAKHLKYDEIVNMCLTNSQFVKLCESRIFWITYLKDVHDITGVNDLDIDLLKRGVKFIETKYDHEGFNRIDEDLYIFVKRLYWPENYFNPDNFINLIKLSLGSDTQELDLSNLVNLQVLYLNNNHHDLNFSNLVNLHYLNLGSNDKELDLSKLVNLRKLSLGLNNNQDLDFSKLVNLNTLYLGRNNQDLDLSKLINLHTLYLVHNNQDLDLSKLVKLYALYLGHNDQDLDLSNLNNLHILDLGNNNQELDFSKLSNLDYLYLGHNNQELDLSKLVKLTTLILGYHNRDLILPDSERLDVYNYKIFEWNRLR